MFKERRLEMEGATSQPDRSELLRSRLLELLKELGLEEQVVDVGISQASLSGTRTYFIRGFVSEPVGE